MTINLNLVEIQDFFHTAGRVSIKTIKRTPRAVTSKKPYVDWANSSDDGGVDSGPISLPQTAYPIPEECDENNCDILLRGNFAYIYEGELNLWMADLDE